LERELVDPRILLTDTYRAGFAARLAMAFSKARCSVAGICPSHHPFHKTRGIQRTFRYSGIRPLDSLRRAIEEFDPHVIVPCDDRGVKHLHELYALERYRRGSGTFVAEIIERSLGSPKSYPTVSARNELLRIAREEGVRVPETNLIESLDDLKCWNAERAYPFVLKADGTSGGRGVRIAHNREQAEQFFLELKNGFRFTRAIKRLCVNRDAFWFRPWWKGEKCSVIVQSYVQGRPGNCAVVCWDGKVLAGIGVEALSTQDETGPACIVRIVDSPRMMEAAERIACRLRLSGFFGLDFVIEDETQAAILIEMNPRCTPACHLQLGETRDMVRHLTAQLTGQATVPMPRMTENDLIAYFPQAWKRKDELFETSFHDIPDQEPDLVKELLKPWPDRTLLYRLFAHLQQMVGAKADSQPELYEEGELIEANCSKRG
jgi:hypothetical protein